MTNKFSCGFPDKHWKGEPRICPCGWVFPYRFHPNPDGSWTMPKGEEPRMRKPRERLPRKRERLDLFDFDD